MISEVSWALSAACFSPSSRELAKISSPAPCALRFSLEPKLRPVTLWLPLSTLPTKEPFTAFEAPSTSKFTALTLWKLLSPLISPASEPTCTFEAPSFCTLNLKFFTSTFLSVEFSMREASAPTFKSEVKVVALISLSLILRFSTVAWLSFENKPVSPPSTLPNL